MSLPPLQLLEPDGVHWLPFGIAYDGPAINATSFWKPEAAEVGGTGSSSTGTALVAHFRGRRLKGVAQRSTDRAMSAKIFASLRTFRTSRTAALPCSCTPAAPFRHMPSVAGWLQRHAAAPGRCIWQRFWRLGRGKITLVGGITLQWPHAVGARGQSPRQQRLHVSSS